MQVEKVQIDMWDIEELACVILGLDYDEIDADTSVIEEALWEEFEVDLYAFKDIISRLLPLIDVGKSPLTEKIYKGFADNQNQRWIIKTEVEKLNT